jgi:hypothetical protein
MLTNFPFGEEKEIDLGIPPVAFIKTQVNSLPLDCGLFVAPYVPTDEQVSKKALELAGLTDNDILIDLGCGDGIIFKNAPCQAIGVELDDVLYKYCVDHYPNVKMLNCDLFIVDLVQLGCTVAILYLLPSGLKKLKPMLQQWLSTNRSFRVVTIYYQIEGFKPVKQLACKADGGFQGGSVQDKHILYYYDSRSC